jgi:hypothetical protein
MNSALAYNYGYWLAGYMARSPAEVIRLTSTVRAVEAAGGAVASGISSTHAPVWRFIAEWLVFLLTCSQLIAALGVNFGLWGLAVFPTYLVVRLVGIDRSNDENEEDNPSKDTEITK